MLSPKVGYGTNAQLPARAAFSGFYKFRVNNVKELELLLMHNRKFAAEISHAVSPSASGRRSWQRANQLNIKVTNAFAKVQH